jgi:hypothetical protein
MPETCRNIGKKLVITTSWRRISAL